MTKNQALLKEQFPEVSWSFDLLLADKSYFKLGGSAEIFYKVKDLALLKKILNFCEEQSIPWTLVGGLSNVVIADSGIDGLVLQMACNAFNLINQDSQEITFEAEAGIKTNQLVMKAANLGGTGLEGFIGVPGTLGGAIYNNAHYLDFLIGDYIEEVTSFHVKNDEEIIFSHEKCEFAYEQSVFQNPPNTEFLKKIFPQFANQEFIPAGFLIDKAGLKGQRQGAIVVSDKHAAFLINLTDQLKVPAKSSDLKKLISLIRSTVKEKFQVELKEEIFYLGKD